MYRIIRESEIHSEERGGGDYTLKRLLTAPLTGATSIGVIQTTIPAGNRVVNHVHMHLEELLCFLTPASINVEGTRYEMNPGDWVYLGRGTAHEIYAGAVDTKLIALRLPEISDDKTLLPAPSEQRPGCN